MKSRQIKILFVLSTIVLTSAVFMATVFTAATVYAADDVVSIMRKIDNNEVFSSMKAEALFQIEFSGKKIIKRCKMISKGSGNAFIEFMNPEDAGTKMLKKDGNLFLYSPDAEEVIPITGHMLKESMMGSDLSYEDTVENDSLENLYNGRILSETELDGKACWEIELTGKKKTLSYPKQKIWVDKESYIALKAELYALSGALLKEERVLETKLIGKRLFPVKIEVRDLLRKNSKTIFTFSNLELDIEVPDSVFSMRNLEG